jgi:hypothetical protein
MAQFLVIEILRGTLIFATGKKKQREESESEGSTRYSSTRAGQAKVTKIRCYDDGGKGVLNTE